MRSKPARSFNPGTQAAFSLMKPSVPLARYGWMGVPVARRNGVWIRPISVRFILVPNHPARPGRTRWEYHLRPCGGGKSRVPGECLCQNFAALHRSFFKITRHWLNIVRYDGQERSDRLRSPEFVVQLPLKFVEDG